MRGVVSTTRCSPPSAARVLVTPSAEVLEGDDVSLTCEVLGELQADAVFSWYKDSKHVQDSPGRVLELPHVTSDAAGSYHCKAHGPAGTGASVSPAVSLRVLCEWGEGTASLGTRSGSGDMARGVGRGTGPQLAHSGARHGPCCRHRPRMAPVQREAGV